MSLQWSPEQKRFLRFCVVGVANTLLHLAVVYTLVEVLGLLPTMANVLAFIVANLFSFLVNSRWTFQQAAGLQRYSRFLVVSLTGLVLSWLCVALAGQLGVHYMLGVIASVGAVAVSGYLLNRRFVFR